MSFSFYSALFLFVFVVSTFCNEVPTIVLNFQDFNSLKHSANETVSRLNHLNYEYTLVSNDDGEFGNIKMRSVNSPSKSYDTSVEWRATDSTTLPRITKNVNFNTKYQLIGDAPGPVPVYHKGGVVQSNAGRVAYFTWNTINKEFLPGNSQNVGGKQYESLIFQVNNVELGIGGVVTSYKADIWAYSDTGKPTWEIENTISQSYTLKDGLSYKLQLDGYLGVVRVDLILFVDDNGLTCFPPIKYGTGEAGCMDPHRTTEECFKIEDLYKYSSYVAEDKIKLKAFDCPTFDSAMERCTQVDVTKIARFDQSKQAVCVSPTKNHPCKGGNNMLKCVQIVKVIVKTDSSCNNKQSTSKIIIPYAQQHIIHNKGKCEYRPTKHNGIPLSDLFDYYPFCASYKGCFVDGEHGRALQFNTNPFQELLGGRPYSHSKCRGACMSIGKRYYSLQYYRECFCDDVYNRGSVAPLGDCNYPCDVDEGQTCGAADRNQVYDMINCYNTHPL